MSLPRRLALAATALGRGVGELLIPSVCGACGQEPVESQGLCEKCNVGLLTLVASPYCPRCGATLGPNVPTSPEGCYDCPTVAYRFERLVRLGPYSQPLRAIIVDLKYRRQEALRRRLGGLLAMAVAAACRQSPPDLVLAIPMHWRRRISRGYDHARMIATVVADELGLPLGDELVRCRHTPPQARLTRTRRIENVKGAFASRDESAIAGAHVLLVDDVSTTGATANEAARTLLSAGASRVTLAVFAKAQPPKGFVGA